MIFADINDLLYRAVIKKNQEKKYYEAIKPGEYRSGAIAACPVRVALRYTILIRNMSKLLLPVDPRYTSYGDFIHEGVQDVISRYHDQDATITAERPAEGVWGKAGIRISSRADLVLQKPNSLQTFELKTCSEKAVKFYPQKFPYPYHLLQMCIAFSNTREADMAWREQQKLPKIEYGASLVYFPRDIVRHSPDWFLLKYHYTEDDIAELIPWVERSVDEWHELFLQTVSGKVDIDRFRKYFNGMGMSDVFCENCDCRKVCPAFEGTDYGLLAPRG